MSSKKVVKLSNFSAVIYSLSSMIGIGIFMKTNSLSELSGGKFAPIFFLLIGFLVGILCFCYVIRKIIDKQTGDMGIIEWSKDYCPVWLHRRFCNFIRFFYHPVSLYIFSVYAVTKFTSSINLGVTAISLLSLFLVFIVMVINFVSFKWSMIIHKYLWRLLIIPLIFIPLLGLAGGRGENISEDLMPRSNYGGWSVLITGLPALLFIYDGFYNITTLKSKLEKPNDLKKIVIVSIVIVTITYMYVMLGFHSGDPINGNYRNFKFFRTYPGFIDVFEIFLGIASLLTLNSIAISTMPQLTKMNRVHKFDDEQRFQKLVFYKGINQKNENETKLSLWIYLVIKTAVVFFIVWLIMIISKKNTMSDITNVINILSDSVSLFVFLIIVGVIISNFHKNYSGTNPQDSKYKLSVYIACGMISITLFYMIISSLIGLFKGGNEGALNILKLLTLIVFTLGSCLDIIWDKMKYSLNRKNKLYPNIKGKGAGFYSNLNKN